MDKPFALHGKSQNHPQFRAFARKYSFLVKPTEIAVRVGAEASAAGAAGAAGVHVA